MEAKVYYTTDPGDDDIIVEQVLTRGTYTRCYKPSGRKFKKWRVPSCIYTDKNSETEFDVPTAPPEDKRVVMYTTSDFIPFYYVLME